MYELIQQLSSTQFDEESEIKKIVPQITIAFEQMLKIVYKNKFFKAFNSEIGKTMAKFKNNSELYHSIVKICIK